MNRSFKNLLFSFIASTSLISLNAMSALKRQQNQLISQEQQNALNDLLCCLQDIPTDLDPLIIRRIIAIQIAPYFDK